MNKHQQNLMEKDFITMVNNNRALIFKVCNLYSRDHEDRKDLFQEIILQLWKSFPSFRRDAANTTWTYRVALNTAISNFRKELRKPEKSSLSDAEFEIPDISDLQNVSDKNDSLREAIDKLTEIEKAIILLYLEEKSYEEMSEIMGISISNVGVRLNRIKNKLSNLVKTI